MSMPPRSWRRYSSPSKSMACSTSLPVVRLISATSGMSSVMRYMCSIASTGCSRPTMCPTSRAQSPPALTTCSAWISPRLVITRQVPSGFWISSSTLVKRSMFAPSLRAALA